MNNADIELLAGRAYAAAQRGDAEEVRRCAHFLFGLGGHTEAESLVRFLIDMRIHTTQDVDFLLSMLDADLVAGMKKKAAFVGELPHEILAAFPGEMLVRLARELLSAGMHELAAELASLAADRCHEDISAALEAAEQLLECGAAQQALACYQKLSQRFPCDERLSGSIRKRLERTLAEDGPGTEPNGPGAAGQALAGVDGRLLELLIASSPAAAAAVASQAQDRFRPATALSILDKLSRQAPAFDSLEISRTWLNLFPDDVEAHARFGGFLAKTDGDLAERFGKRARFMFPNRYPTSDESVAPRGSDPEIVLIVFLGRPGVGWLANCLLELGYLVDAAGSASFEPLAALDERRTIFRHHPGNFLIHHPLLYRDLHLFDNDKVFIAPNSLPADAAARRRRTIVMTRRPSDCILSVYRYHVSDPSAGDLKSFCAEWIKMYRAFAEYVVDLENVHFVDFDAYRQDARRALAGVLRFCAIDAAPQKIEAALHWASQDVNGDWEAIAKKLNRTSEADARKTYICHDRSFFHSSRAIEMADYIDSETRHQFDAVRRKADGQKA